MKGQISMEFLFMVSAMAIFSVILLGIISYYSNINLHNKNDDAISNLLDYLQNEIILATKMNNGYNQIFKLPETINGENYSVKIQSNLLSVFYKGDEYATIIPTVNGNITIPDNTIKNKNGVVYLNE